MGKKDKGKKKGKGAEKTAAKTEKKMSNKMKKELEAMGEDDIENIVAQIEKEEKERMKLTETVVEPPSRRVNFTFVAHPTKEELILFGGEFFNGQKTLLFNDLYFYNINNDTWTLLKGPGSPPPRCGHQMVVTSTNKGQLWVFGGEFSSPSQSQFYHYRDLWVFHVATKQWEKIAAPNGPSARTGHRMVYHKKMIFVFGGFHDNLRDYKYFNDIYCFNTETYTWHKLEPTGNPPSARSGCCFVALADGKLLVYGGYSKEKCKKDVDKGHVYTDSYLLVPDKNDTTGLKYKWVTTKIGGLHMSPRCSMPITCAPNNTAYCFGGVFDTEEDEENICGEFFNDLYCLDTEKVNWRLVTLSERKEKTKGRRKKDKTSDNNEDVGEEDDETMEEEEPLEEKLKSTTISDDGIFKVSIGPAVPSTLGSTTGVTQEKSNVFTPCPRMNCGMAIKHGVLYLYGGMFEDGDKEVTLKDFYSLDLKKLETWNTIIGDDQAVEWLGSDSESDGDEESDGSSDEDEEMDTD